MEGINTYSPNCLIEAQLRARICDIEALVKGGVLKYLPTGQFGIMTTDIVPPDETDRLHRTIDGLRDHIAKEKDFTDRVLSNDKRLNFTVDGLRADIRKRDTTIEELKYELNRYRSSDSANTIASLRRINALLHKQFRAHYDAIGELEDIVTENGVNAESAIADLNISVKVKDNTIMCLNKHIDEKDRKIDEQRTTIGELRSKVDMLPDNCFDITKEYQITICDMYKHIKVLQSEISARKEDCKEDSKMLSKVIEIIDDDSINNSEAGYRVSVAVKDRI